MATLKYEPPNPYTMNNEKEYTVMIEKDEDGYYVGEVVELPGCFSQAKSVEELMKRMKEAISLYLETVDEVEVKYRFIGLQKVIA